MNIYKKFRVTLLIGIVTLSLHSCREKATTQEQVNSSTMQVAIDHYAINVTNLNKSVEFYQKVFELKEITSGTGLSHIRWLRLGKTQELHIIQVDSLDKRIPKGVHLALAVSDFDRFRENIIEQNISYSDWPGKENAISIRPDKVRQLYFQDPDGYWVEVNDGKQF